MGDGVTHIDEPHIREFYRCNVWHVRGRDGDMLVDSGMGVVSLRAEVALVAERPRQAVASHTHFDHIGCHAEFPCRLCHGAEAHLLRAPTRENTFADRYVTDDIFTALPPEPYASETYTVAPARDRRGSSGTATSSTWATATSRSSTPPATAPAASPSGRPRPASSSPATSSTTES